MPMIAAWFKRQSVPNKMRILIAGTVTAALLIAITLLSIIEIVSYRQGLADRIATLARITAVNAGAATEFQDRIGARALMESLKSEPTIAVAEIFAANGPLLGRYTVDKDRSAASLEELRTSHAAEFGGAQLFDPSAEQRLFSADHLDVTAPVRLDSETIGYVHIEASLDTLYATLALYAGTALLVMLAALAVAYTATGRLRDSISKPLTGLVDVMRHVSNRQDYQARASKTGDDEIGALVDGFNQMLGQIQDRDQRLDQRRRQLEHDVAERTQHLESALQSARQASRAKSDFLARMSHEIRTPMNGVLGMTELLRNSALDPRQKRLVDTVYSSGEALLQIINDILDFSKVEAGRMELAHTDFVLRDVVEETCEFLGERADAKELELICAIDDNVPTWVNGDALRLKQILINLIGNAIKFTDRGDVALRVKRQSGAARLRFEVRDSGPGISSDDQKQLFEPFTQSDALTTRAHGGTGLGLAIARQLVTLMRGQIGLESRLGKGATFWFEIPYGAAVAQPVAHIPRLSLAGMRALVVDDNAASRELLHHHLNNWGVSADVCQDGERALARMQAAAQSGKPYDVAILDHRMPRMDGVTCLRRIRNSPALRDSHVILLSSMDLSLRTAELSALKIDESLTKPVRPARLYTVLSRMLGHDLSMQTGSLKAQPTIERNADLQGIRALLVEDNEVNREVALGMLAALGCHARLAINGAQALEMFERANFDVVLMDCHMPVMDGFSAAAAMRSMETEQGRPRTPIVALTANALEGARERCLAAGMDDFLCKPFSMTQLRTTLEAWIRKTPAAPAPATPPSSSSSNSIINPRAIDAIQMLKSPDLLPRIVALYVERAPLLVRDGHEAVLAKDTARLAIAAHELKSSSAHLGGERLALACRECETAARNNAWDDARRLWPDVCSEFDQFLHAIKNLKVAARAS